jgi:DinB superfamily/Pentapeptide repeats (8 copies)
MTRFDNADLTGAVFREVDLSGAVFREVNFAGARMRGVYLANVDIDGAIEGLRINGVEVGPLVLAELDRVYPERTKLRPTTAESARAAWATVAAMWAPTMARAASLTDEEAHRSVDEEWSFVDTQRHLVMAMDSWFGAGILAQARPFHPLGLPFSSDIDFTAAGLDLAARPSLAEIAEVRAERCAALKSYLDSLTDDEFHRERMSTPGLPWPPSASRSPQQCLQVILNEEWAHHRFAVRDLDAMRS